MRRIALVLILAFPVLLLADPPAVEWSHTYGGPNEDGGYRVLQTPDGGFLAAGYMDLDSDRSYVVWLLRTTASGDSLWSRRYGCNRYDFVESIARTSDGGYVLLAYTEGCWESGALWMLRTTENGDSLWSRHFAVGDVVDRAFVEETDDGGFIVLYSAWHIKLIRTDASGDSLWTRDYSSAGEDRCLQLRQNSDGGYTIIAQGNGDGYGNWDLWIMRTNAQGDSVESVWCSLAADFRRCDAARFTADGNIILSCLQGPIHGPYAAWLIKISTAGDTLWSRSYFSQLSDRSLLGVEALADGGFLLTGTNRIIRTDSLGNPLWQFDTYPVAMIYGAAQTADSGFILTGVFGDHAFYSDLWLLKLAPELSSDLPQPGLPVAFELSVHPNPFNPVTTLSFNLPRAALSRLAVFDVTGRLVTILADERMEAGTYAFLFDGFMLATGLYFARLEAEGVVQTRKLVLLK